MSAKMELMAYQQRVTKRVFILTCEEASCPECRKLSGRVYTIDKALREKPILANAVPDFIMAEQGAEMSIYTSGRIS